MPETPKAVFLSYASQDVEAARKISDALRSAGVEVWFDAEGGLEHGDEWDAKIRRQIKECVLFIPIISANTQAREEGYFRIEWELAAQRALGIASGVAFILPVVVDGTREPNALVPDRFRAVQWTRLPGGDVPPDVKARFLKLWSHRIGVVKHEAQREAESAAPPNRPVAKKRGLILALLAGAAAIVVGGVYFGMRRGASPTGVVSAGAVVPAADGKSASSPVGAGEARQWVAQAWEQLNKADLERAELERADGLCKRATEIDPGDADAWAAWSQVDSWYIYHNFDQSPARREGARTKATRALQLAPAAFEARLAEACYMVRGASGSGGGGQANAMDARDADGILAGLLREQPDEPRTLLARGILQRNLGQAAEARSSFEQLARNPAFAALAWNEIGWAEMFGPGDSSFERATIAADRSIALQPYWGNLSLRMLIAEAWLGDLDLAKAALEKIPLAVRQEDYGVAQACELYYLRREPANMLGVLERVPRDWLHGNNFDGPTAWWAGLAHEIAGHPESARLQWQTALKLVEQHLADQPGQVSLLVRKSSLLVKMGRESEAAGVRQLVRESSDATSIFTILDDALFEASLGHVDAAIPLLERVVREVGPRALTAANLRLLPVFDPLRADPRFQSLLARVTADPRFNPAAKASAGAALDPAKAPDDRSVAVLAFTNLSDDKANEYFSDGISEELINTLTKISGLRVIARTSAFSFKGRNTPVSEIARLLGVAYVIDGSVRKAGNQVRIVVQLVNAATGESAWSERYQRELKDVFATQDEIADAVAKEFRLKVMTAGPATPTINPESFRLFLAGRAKIHEGGSASRDEAIEDFHRALALAPEYAAAWAELARALIQRARTGTTELDAAFVEARAAVKQAVALDPDAPEVLAALGWVRRTADWDWRGAEQAFRRALALHPNHPDVVSGAAVMINNLGRIEESIQLGRRAAELDPLNSEMYCNLSYFLGNADRLAESEQAARRAMELAPKADLIHRLLSNALADVGRLDEAAREAELEPDELNRLQARALVKLRRGDKAGALALAEPLERGANSLQDLAELCALAGARDRALTLLERSVARHETGIAWLKVDNYLDSLHDDPRWTALLRKANLADDQLK